MKNHHTLAVRMLISVGAFLIFGQNAMAQSKKSDQKSTDKIELTYRNILVTSTDSRGRSHSYTKELPLVRTNGGDPVEVTKFDYKTAFKTCPSARKEYDLFFKEQKASRKGLFLGIGGGLACGFGSILGVAAIKGGKGSGAIFGTGMGLAFGGLIYGWVNSRKHQKAAKGHLEESIVNYNKKCYEAPKPTVQPPVDPKTDGKTASMTGSGANKTEADRPGVVKNAQDTLFYKILRNDPKGLDWFSVNLVPIEFEFPTYRGINLYAGGDISFYKGAKFGLAASARYAYVNNLQADWYAPPTSEFLSANPRSYFIGDNYKKGLELGVSGYAGIRNKLAEEVGSVYVGSEKLYGTSVANNMTVKYKRLKSLGIVAGVETKRNLLQSEDNSLPVGTSQATVSVPPVGPVDITYYDNELRGSITMLRTTTLAIGLGRRTVHDLKVDVLNSKFKGIKQGSSYGESYLQLLYAPRIKMDKVRGYFYDQANSHYVSNELVDLDKSRLNRIGVRIGGRFGSPSGWSGSAEFGYYPGLEKTFGLKFGAGYTFGTAR